MTLVKHNYKIVNDLFDEFFKLPATWENERGWNIPPVNIYETNDSYHLELVAPGLKKEDFKINFEKDLLTISYEKKAEDNNKDYKTHRSEFNVAGFKRSFSVDFICNIFNQQSTNQISAENKSLFYLRINITVNARGKRIYRAA